MKIKLFLIAILTLSYVTLLASKNILKSDCNDESVSEFSEEEIYSAFNEIEEVIQYVSSNDNVTYEELSEKDFFSSNISNATTVAMNLQDGGEEPPVFGSFLWGCLFGPIGIVMVAVTTDGDRDQIKKSVWGCALPTGCTIISYAIYFAAYAATYPIY